MIDVVVGRFINAEGEKMVASFGQFPKFVCAGNSIQFQHSSGIIFRAELEFDPDTKVGDYECYSPEDIRRWLSNEWFFGCIVVTACLNGWVIDSRTLSGIEVNFGEDNSYLSQCANELLADMLPTLVDRLRAISEKLLQAVQIPNGWDKV